MATIDDLLSAARARIDALDAELLLAHVAGRGRGWLYAHGEAVLPGGQARAFEALVERRAQGEPVAYLLGSRGFWSLDLQVTPETLVPRPETERLVELALERIPSGIEVDVADLGTGSGAVALALARERPRARVLATDASPGALAVAQANARRLDLGNVRFARGDWWAAVGDARFDVVVSNPPYIAEDDPHLAEGDLPWEPRSALVSGPDGLDAIRAIARGAAVHLHSGGWLLLEHGRDQGPAVRAVLQDAGLDAVATATDLEGRDRVAMGCLPARARASSGES